MYRDTTLLTDKLGLSLAVGLGSMPAAATGATGIPGIYERDRNTGELRFVGDKPSEFIEGPLAEPFPLLFSNRCPEALEIFKDDASPGVFGNVNDSLGDGVVGRAFESSLPAGEFLEMPLGRCRAFLLESFLESVNTNTDILNSGTRETLPIRGHSQIHDAEVNSKGALRFKGCSIWDLDTQAKKEGTLDVEKVRLSPDSSLVELRIGAEEDRELKSPVEAQDGHSIESFKGQDALVIDDGRVRPEHVEPFFLRPVRLGHLADGSNSQLGGKTVGRSDMGIAEMVEPDLSELLLRERNPGDVVAGFVEHFDGLHQGSLLFCGRKEFDFHRELHRCIVANRQYDVKNNSERRSAPSSPWQANGVSGAQK